jgi:tetratricopeptide (TPR) repeat protein
VIALAFTVCGLGVWWNTWSRPNILSHGKASYSSGNWGQAALEARQRLKESPGDPEAVRLAARSAARQDRDQAAIAAYSRLELSLMTGEDYFLLGRALSRTGQDDLALKALEAAHDVDPDRIEMLDELAQVYSRKDRAGAAAAIAERLSQEPGWETRACMMLGTFRAALNDPAGAARCLERAYELDPTAKAAAPHPAQPLWMLMVRSLLQTGRAAKARHYLETIPQVSSAPEFAWLRSRSFFQDKDWKEAAKALDSSASYRTENPLEPEPAPYVGAARCASCHRSIYETHLLSRHSTTFGHARDPGHFPLPDRPLPDPVQPEVTHSFQRLESGIKVETRAGDQVFHALASYALGSPDRFVTLVGSDDKGQSRELRISSYRSPKGSGWDVSTGLDPHPDTPDGFLGPVLEPYDGARRCLSCHTTNFRAIERNVGPESADHSIGCENCHGPGGHHVLAAEASFPDLAIINPGKDNAGATNQLCGRCHDINRPHKFTGEPDDPGWFRFESTRLQASRCYVASGRAVHCVTCHDPHKNAETLAGPYEAKCLSCHGSGLGKTICPVNVTKGCVECHMPRVWREQTHSYKTDHRIRVQKASSERG